MSAQKKKIGRWKTLSSKLVYENQWTKVFHEEVIRPNGEKGIYGVLEQTDGVYVVPLGSRGEIFMIYLENYPNRIRAWEIPAGGCDNEDTHAAAKRELKEEAGLEAKKWTSIGKFQLDRGLVRNWGHVFIAQDLRKVYGAKQEEEGITAAKKFPLKKVLSMIKKGEISDSATIVAITKVLLYLGLMIRE